MKTRADLINQLRVYEQDNLVAADFGFNNAMDQIRALNPNVELVTEGMGVLNQVVNRLVVPSEKPTKDENEDV